MSLKIVYYLTGLVVGLVVLIVNQIPGKDAKLVVCDVGQGDAILIAKGYNQALIDGGPSGEKILDCLGNQIPFWDRKIELIVMTNSDFDHMNGLSTVMERYQVMQLVTADGVHDSEAIERFLDNLRIEGAVVSGVEQGQTVKVGKVDQLSFRVLWPAQLEDEYMAVFSNQIESGLREQILGVSAKRGDLNERSVVLLWEEGKYKTLLMGDAGFQAEAELIEQQVLEDVDILKVGHHGSKYATSKNFIDQIKPEIALISVGASNRYGHPTLEALTRLQNAGAQIKRTDEQGPIVMTIPAAER